ncbi:hypothetical protein ACFL6S_29715 [Candidatus Poribacteria bacterium]
MTHAQALPRQILPKHQKRQAVVYTRQSSPQQVEENLESHDKVIRAQVCWYGGAISELAKAHTDRDIASIPNQDGIKTFRL